MSGWTLMQPEDGESNFGRPRSTGIVVDFLAESNELVLEFVLVRIIPKVANDYFFVSARRATIPIEQNSILRCNHSALGFLIGNNMQQLWMYNGVAMVEGSNSK